MAVFLDMDLQFSDLNLFYMVLYYMIHVLYMMSVGLGTYERGKVARLL